MTLQANPLALAPLAGALASFLVAWLLWSQRQPRSGITFPPITILAGLWNLGTAVGACLDDDAGALWLGRLVIGVVVLVGPAVMAFFTAFARVRRRWVWVTASLAIGVAGMLATILDPQVLVGVRVPPWGGRYPVGGPHLWIPLVATQLVCVPAGVLAVRVWRRTPPSRRRRQAFYLALSLFIGLAAGLDVLGLKGWNLPPIGWATILVSLAILNYAIARHQLMDAPAVLAGLAFWSVLVLATVVPLYPVFALSAGWSGWGRFLTRAVAVAVILLVARLYAWRMELALRRWRDRRQAGRALVVERFAVRARGWLTPDELVPVAAQALLEGAGLELAAVGLAIDLGDGRPPAARLFVPPTIRSSDSKPQMTAAELMPAGPWPEPPPESATARGDLDPEAVTTPGATDRLVARWLDAFAGDVIVPMWHAGDLVGLMAARRRGALAGSAGVSLSEPERAFLERLAAHAAVAFTNAILHQDLSRRSADLEREVAERTRVLESALEDLKAAQATLVQAEKQSALGILVAGVSHEINNALNFIYANLPVLAKYAETYTEILERGRAVGAEIAPGLLSEARDSRRRMIEDVEALGGAARRGRAIVDDLRHFARHDEAERKRVDVREGLASTLNLLGPELRGRIVVERRFEAAPPLVIDCFPAALNHVFLNVLLNAVHAVAGAGSIVIDATLAAGGGGDDAAVITITDDGSGVPSDILPRVFEPYFSTRPRAAGLGLAVSRQIVGRHGGTISLGPAPAGRGARVTITLPAAGPPGL
jgi:signal transduction histidine kinase